jgi:hypothetical protein
MADPGKRSRDTAEAFGKAMEDTVDAAERGVDALRKGASPEVDEPGDEGTGEITINIKR